MMTKGVALKLDFNRKLLLLAAGWMTVGTPVQSQVLHADGPMPSFEVATIKPSKPDESRYVLMDIGRYTAKHISLREFIKYAYEIKLDDQLVGGPSWIGSEFFDVDAKVGESESEFMKKLGSLGRVEQSHLMLQSLLKDRFQLRVSSKTEEHPAYALVVAKGGPRLKEVEVSPEVASSVKPPPPPPPTNGSTPTLRQPPGGPFPGIRRTGTNQFTATAFRMSWLADWLLYQGEIGNRVVVDQTGLKGNYDFVLNGISVASSALPGATPMSPDDFTVSIFTATLPRTRLHRKFSADLQVPVEVLVIDHVEQPSKN